MKQIIVKLFFVLFIFIFSAEKVWAADTSTTDISYYFNLESRGFSGDSSVMELLPFLMQSIVHVFVIKRQKIV